MNTMSAPSAPITQDLITIPRKMPDGPINLVGLSRDAMRELLIEHGTKEKQAKMRVVRFGSGSISGAYATLLR